MIGSRWLSLLFPLSIVLCALGSGCGTTVSALIAQHESFKACKLLANCTVYRYSGTDELVALGDGCSALRIKSAAAREQAEKQLVQSVARESGVRLQLLELGQKELTPILKTVDKVPPANVTERSVTLGLLIDTTQASTAVHVESLRLEGSPEPLRDAREALSEYVEALGGERDHSVTAGGPTGYGLYNPTPLYKRGGLLGLVAILGHMMTAGIFLVPDLIESRSAPRVKKVPSNPPAASAPELPSKPPESVVSWFQRPDVELIGALGTPSWNMHRDEPGDMIPAGTTGVVSKGFVRGPHKDAMRANPGERAEVVAELGLRLYAGRPPVLPAKPSDRYRPWLDEPPGQACVLPHIYLRIPLPADASTLSAALAALAARGPQPLFEMHFD